MKLFQLLILLSLSFLLANCDKEDDLDCSPKDGDGTEVQSCVPVESPPLDSFPDIPIFEKGEQQWGWATAVKGSKEWEASTVFVLDDEEPGFGSLRMIAYDSTSGFKEEHLYIYDIPLDLGCYTVEVSGPDQNSDIPRANYYITDENITGAIEAYSVDQSEYLRNKIEITQIDTLAKTISGKFSISLVYYVFDLDVPKYYPGNPIYLRFYNGAFETRWDN